MAATHSIAHSEADRQPEQRQAFLLRLSDALRAQLGVDAITNLTVRLLAEALHLDRCYIAIFHPDEDLWKVGAEFHRSNLPPLPPVFRPEDHPESIRLIAEQTLTYEDTAKHPGLTDVDRASLSTMGFGALLAAGLRKGERNPIWALAAVSELPRPWTPAEVALVEEVAERTWAAFERARTETALRESEERLQLAVAAGELATWDWDVRTGRVVWNDAQYAMQGYAVGEVAPSYEAWAARIHPDDRAGAVAALENARDTRTAYRCDYRAVHPDGAVRWLSARGSFFYDETGSAVRMVGVMRDVAEQRTTEAALQKVNDELEARVQARTAELEPAPDSLVEEMTRRRELARRLASSQEDERRRVSRELHDTVGQFMVGLALALKSIETADHLPAHIAAKLADAQEIANILGKEVHGLAVRLRPTSLDDVGLEPALSQLVSEWSTRTRIVTEFQAAGLGPGRLPVEVETTVYRVVQEALTNVAKHAQASQVSVVVSRGGGRLSAAVEDNGIGFDAESARVGRLGLLGMQERAAQIGGDVKIESECGQGTTLLLRIPLIEEKN